MALRTVRPRRTTDRLEDAVAWVLLAAGLLVLLLGYALGVRVHEKLTDQDRVEALGRSQAVATLLERAPTIASADATGAPVEANATWQDRSGGVHTGFVTVPQGLAAGGTVPVWITRSGVVVPAPASAGDVFVVAATAAGLTVVTGLSVLAALWEIVRRLTLAHNCAAWEREWREVAPLWSRGEGRRG